MIDTANSTRCKNPKCGKPVHQTPGPHRPKEYCNDTCKEIAYRLRKKGITDGSVTVVDESTQQRIAELEQELAKYRKIVDLDDRQKMNAAFMDTGQIIGWLALRSIDLNPGEYAWREYAKRADDKQMAIALAGARNMYKVIKDLQTTEEVARLNNLVATLRQKLRECEKRKQS